MKDDRYVHIDIPPYIEPDMFYKQDKRLSDKGFSNLVVLSVITSIVSVGIIVLGVYLGM